MSDIVINGTTYEGVESITANTTDGGTATFSEGAGGVDLYQHHISLNCNRGDQSGYFNSGFTIINTTPNEFTTESLYEYLNTTNAQIPATGVFLDPSDNSLKAINKIRKDSMSANKIVVSVPYVANSSLGGKSVSYNYIVLTLYDYPVKI